MKRPRKTYFKKTKINTVSTFQSCYYAVWDDIILWTINVKIELLLSISDFITKQQKPVGRQASLKHFYNQLKHITTTKSGEEKVEYSLNH